MSSGQDQSNIIWGDLLINKVQNVILIYVVQTKPADSLASLGARPSAGTVMANVESWVRILFLTTVRFQTKLRNLDLICKELS